MNNCSLNRIYNPAAMHSVFEGRVTDLIGLLAHREGKVPRPDSAVRAAQEMSLMSRRVF